MSDEAGFLHAIAEAPTEDTTRLVYADWLDEHDEPHKAAFLRAECAWASEPEPTDDPPPEGARYPPALRALSDLADRVRPEWFAAVSRIAHEVRGLADRFVARVPRVKRGSVAHPIAQYGRWVGALTEVRASFIQHVGDRVVWDRLAVPVDYFAFALCVGGLTCPDEFGMTYFDWLSGPAETARETVGSNDGWAEMHGPNADLAACGLWLFVGNRDRHDFHLCCDRASPLFGTLVDMHDTHPWIGPPHGPSSDVEARSFLDFLREQVARAESDWAGV